ncbi:queuine tRNA-ribosyltransferase accessory subunit 2-like [Liolophura sinensis]|uniref:queuine tRNA-ribosyltransferase accessory subunit 2-like n=1 Tax=Liolophura sinensis TaxID=3198878 RepID=UPI003158ED29
MKFVIRAAHASGCRRGAMVEFARHPDKVVETPVCSLYTRGGSVPHLTPDIWEKLTNMPSLVQMPMPLLVEHHEAVRGFQKGLGGITAMHVS